MRRVALIGLAAVLVAPTAADGRLVSRKRHVRHHEAVRAMPKPPTPRPGRPVPKPPTGKPPTTPVPKPLARVQVIAREFSLTLSRGSLAAGLVAIELDNFGQDPHDLRVERVDSSSTGFSFELAKPSTVSSQKFTLTPGDWKLYCTLPGHEALGMSALLTVTG